MSRTLTDPSGGNTINRVLPIYNGGSEEITAPDALLAFNGVPASEYNQPNGVASLNSQGKLPFNILPDSVSSSVSVIGPTLLYLGSKGEWTITNYDNRIQYTVIASAGFITRSDDIVYFTAPLTPQVVTINIGDKAFEVTIDDTFVNKPTILSPTEGMINAGSGLKVVSDTIDVVGLAISKSLRFKGVNSYLSRTFGTTNKNTHTFSFSVKRAALSTSQFIFGWSNGSSSSFAIRFDSANKLEFWNFNSTYLARKLTTQTFTDISAWLNILVVIDTTNATAEDRVRIYLDNIRITAFDVNVNPAQNQDLFASVNEYGIGRSAGTNSDYFSGYISNFSFVEGQALDPSNFGYQDADLGIWLPKPYTGSYGQNGFYLDFKDSSTLFDLGRDKSGRGNNWTCNNISLTAGQTYDVTDDSPFKRYSIFNAAAGPSLEYRAAGMEATANLSAGAWYRTAVSDFVIPSTGKYYWEMTEYGSSSGDDAVFGLLSTDVLPSAYIYVGGGVGSYGCYIIRSAGGTATWMADGVQIGDMGSVLPELAGTVVGPAVGFAFDADNNKIELFVNGLSRGVRTISASQSGKLRPAVSIYIGNVIFNAGQRPFSYEPPVGYQGLYTPQIHQSTDWQLSDDAGFSNILQESLSDTVNLESWSVSGLSLDTDYYLRCRYTGSLYGTSEWSDTAHVHTRQSWLPINEMQILTASDKAASDYFGFSVALSADGSRLAVGAYQKTVTGTTAAGQVYIYTRSGSTWILETTIAASDKAVSDGFGSSVSFNAAGDRLAIGAQLKDPSGVSNAGKVYTYTRSGSVWSPETTITAPSLYANGYFGSSVSFDSEASRLVIGEYGKNAGGAAFSGQIYIYTRAGSVYTLESQLSASDFAANDSYGVSVALDGSGSRLAVGAYGKDDTYTDTGKVYIYTRSGTAWTLEVTITASDKIAGDQFGTSVCFNTDATILAIGAFNKDVSGLTDSGKVYIYTRSGSAWTLEAEISASDKATTDWFGYGVSLSADGSLLAIGAPSRISNGITDSGAVYIFQ